MSQPLKNFGGYIDKLKKDSQHVSILCHCSCKLKRPVHELYFCDECVQLACDECAHVEIETHYCPGCLSNVLSNVALQDNKCKQCVECPICFQTLHTVVDSQTRLYKYYCELCKWMSDGIGLVDSTAQGLMVKLFERERSVSGRESLSKLIKMYQGQDKLQRRARSDRGSLSLSFSLNSPTNFAFSPRMSLSGFLPPSLMEVAPPPTTLDEVESMVAARQSSYGHHVPSQPVVNQLPPIPPHLLTEFDISTVSSLAQRFRNPASQNAILTELYPRRKNLLNKPSYRCRQCKKIIIKPAIETRTPKFEKRLLAMQRLPKMTVAALPSWQLNQAQKIIVYFSNPVQCPLRLSLHPLPPDSELMASLRHQSHKSVLTQMRFSNAPVLLNPLDVISQHDDIWDEDEKSEILPTDDPEVVAYRRQNKVGIIVELTPTAQHIKHLKYIKYPFVRFTVQIDLAYESENHLAPFRNYSYFVDFNLGSVQIQ
eukprot:TRINITY_DN8699_c0_g1_i3.p1 TRINITY_DN8699_c0_g1~~TRINITY_DN8699_c0_g1_i3.p1  ORF type:complete len:503 (+),score=57.84 TRINITY_DN8699_c0_g1_i3:63-1511(+)